MDQVIPITERAATLIEPAEIPVKNLVQNWMDAYNRGVAYLQALGIPRQDQHRITLRAVETAARRSWPEGGNALTETMAVLKQLVMETFSSDAPGPGYANDFYTWRLKALLNGGFPERLRFDPAEAPIKKISSMPPLLRGVMKANRFKRGWLRRKVVPYTPDVQASVNGQVSGNGMPADRRELRSRRKKLKWPRVGLFRRLLLCGLVLIPAVIASLFILKVLPSHGRNVLEMAIALFFAILFGWISIGFWTALLGFFVLLFSKDRFKITSTKDSPEKEMEANVRSAIIVPICEEPVERVFSGLKAMRNSLKKINALKFFDFFILSDTRDPEIFLAEESAWFEWCREVDGFENIFYRRRQVRTRRKSGNVADFCRRWGRKYRYMVELDADSLMAGETIVSLVRMMEAHDDVGIIQTVPIVINRFTLFARIQQFANRLYGPLFAAGLHFWQLGDGQYWGHNAIIRVAPFMEHCDLPKLPGNPPFGGEILSHDFVESALLGRAGWSIWLAYDLPGSYEEPPSSLLDEMGRDRRWCQGNLQHLKVIFTKDLIGAHRALFINGALSYVSAFLWFIFLFLSTVRAVLETVLTPQYFGDGRSLFPNWPVFRPDWGIELIAVTAAILFLPKILGIGIVVFRWKKQRLFGGTFRLLISVLLEFVVSALLAPIRMMFHTRFVILNLLGKVVSWNPQQRTDAATSWKEAIRYHGLDTLIGIGWSLGLFALNPRYFWWLMPISGALILSVPLSVYTSRIQTGNLFLRWRIFTTPEEMDPPEVLKDLRSIFDASGKSGNQSETAPNRFVSAVIHPYLNVLHAGLSMQESHHFAPSIESRRNALLEQAVNEGPDALNDDMQRMILHDSEMVLTLHDRLWREGSRTMNQWMS